MKADKERLKGLWVGFGVYFVIMLFAIPYAATRVPYQVFALGGLINATIIICFFVVMNKVRRRIGEQRQSESKDVSCNPVKYQSLKKFRWLFFAAAVIGIAETPSAIQIGFSNAKSDHLQIILLAGAVVIRLLVICFFLKIWWATRKISRTNSSPNGPTAN